MDVDLHMEVSGTTKNSDFVKYILQKWPIAKIVSEVAVTTPETARKTSWKPSEEASEASERALGSPERPERTKKSQNFHSTRTVALKVLLVVENAMQKWLYTSS